MLGLRREESATPESDRLGVSAGRGKLVPRRRKAAMRSLPGPPPATLRACVALALCCIALGPAATTAAAAPTWLARQDLSAAGTEAYNAQVAVGADGEAVVVWEDKEGSNSETIQAAERPAGGEWSTPKNLSAGTHDARAPQVAISPDGEAIAVWVLESESGHKIVQAAERPAGGEWSTTAESLSAETHNAQAPQVAISPDGEAVVVWEDKEGSNSETIQAAERPAGGEWSKPKNLSETAHNAQAPQVAISPNGEAVAVWVLLVSSNKIVQAAERPAGGKWSTAEPLSAETQNAPAPQVAIGPEGQAVAVWAFFNGSNDMIQAAERPAGGKWSTTAERLSAEEEGHNAQAAQVAIGSEGQAVAVWMFFEGGKEIIQATERPAGGKWSTAAAKLSAEGHNAEVPQVAMSPGGDAVAVWMLESESGKIIQAAQRPAGGKWSTAAEDLSAEEQTAEIPQVAVDPQGDAVAVWERYEGSSSEWLITAAGYDAAGPQLRSLAIPTAGKTGQSLSFSVSPLDVWSALGQTSWSFGDGTSATGTSVTHAYAKAGSYQVTLTGQDALGNTSTATGTVTITAPAPEPESNPAPSPEEHPAPQPKPLGQAFAAHLVHVKGKIALVRLHCRGKGRCHGVVKLIDRIKVKRVVKRHGRRKTIRRNKRVVIGKASFTVAAGNTKTIKVKLTAKGRAQLRKARHHRLKAQVAGQHVKRRAVLLIMAGKRRKHA